MKTMRIFPFIACMLGLCVFGGARAAPGICVDVDGCNDYYFALDPLTPGTYAIHGYEYGCGELDRYATGVLRKEGDTYFIGFTGANRQLGYFDYPQQVTWNGAVAVKGLVGDYNVFYTYMSGGVLSSHGSEGSLTLRTCSEPNVSEATGASEPDSSLFE